MDIYSWILTLAILGGQLFKIPLVSNQGGLTLLDITVLSFCLMGLLKLKFKLKKPPLFFLSALAFILVCIISLIFTPIHLTLPQYLTSFFYTLRFAAYILLGWIIYSGGLVAVKKQTPKVFILSGLGLAFLGLLQLVFLPDLMFLSKDGWDPHYFRAVSTFLDPNFTGSFLVLISLLIFQNFAIAKKWKIFFFVVIYLAILTTFSRGSYLAFFVSFISLSVLQKSFKLLIVATILFSGLLLGFYTYQGSVAKPRGIDRTQSAEFRLNTWLQGLSLFQKAPILGTGFNSYRYGVAEYNLADTNFLKSHGASTNDSSLLYVAATTGILGLTSYLFFLASLLKTAWEKQLQKNPWGQVLTAGLLGIIIQSFFANTLFYPFILIWIILIAVKLFK